MQYIVKHATTMENYTDEQLKSFMAVNDPVEAQNLPIKTRAQLLMLGYTPNQIQRKLKPVKRLVWYDKTYRRVTYFYCTD